MITVEKSRSWQGVAISAALAAAAAGAYWAFAPSNDGGAAQGNSNAGNGMWPGMGNSASVVATGAPDLNPPVLADGRPSDLSEADWNSLEAALKRQPNAKAEATRIVSYLRYQKAFETWQNLDEQRDARKRRQMAEALMSELPERMKSGEFTLVEATLMGVVLVADMEPDEAKRTQRAEAWQAKVGSMVGGMVANPEDEAQMAALNRETEFKRRRASAFGDWQLKTEPAERSPAKLSQAMEDIQRMYNSGASN
jgi:hypothetical protein